MKRILLTTVLALMFVFGNAVGMDFFHTLGAKEKYTIAYAAPKASKGGFKSGSFSSMPKSSSGGFKSGSFSTTPKSSSGSSTGRSYNYPSSRTTRSFIPFPIPIPFFGGGSFMGSMFLGGIFELVKLIVLFVIIYIIIKNLRRRR